MKKHRNTYYVFDSSGRDTGVRYYASNKESALLLFKADSENYKKYGNYGKLSRSYNGGVYGSTGKNY